MTQPQTPVQMHLFLIAWPLVFQLLSVNCAKQSLGSKVFKKLLKRAELSDGSDCLKVVNIEKNGIENSRFHLFYGMVSDDGLAVLTPVCPFKEAMYLLLL